MVSTVHLVAAGIGVTVVTESMTQLHTDGVVYKTIDGGGPQAAISLAAGPETSKVVERFIGVVMERLPSQPVPVPVLQARRARARLRHA